MNVWTVEDALKGMDCLMAPEAQVSINGCATGRGYLGEDLMESVARQLLLKGGTVSAPETYINLIQKIPSIFDRAFSDAKTTVTLNTHGRNPKVLQMGSDGKIKWSKPPKNVQERAERLKLLASVLELASKDGTVEKCDLKESEKLLLQELLGHLRKTALYAQNGANDEGMRQWEYVLEARFKDTVDWGALKDKRKCVLEGEEEKYESAWPENWEEYYNKK